MKDAHFMTKEKKISSDKGDKLVNILSIEECSMNFHVGELYIYFEYFITFTTLQTLSKYLRSVFRLTY